MKKILALAVAVLAPLLTLAAAERPEAAPRITVALYDGATLIAERQVSRETRRAEFSAGGMGVVSAAFSSLVAHDAAGRPDLAHKGPRWTVSAQLRQPQRALVVCALVDGQPQAQETCTAANGHILNLRLTVQP
jgi:hypothetical protein